MAINSLGNQFARTANRVAISTATTTVVAAAGKRGLATLRVVGGTMGNVTIYESGSASGTVIMPTATPVSGAVLLEDVPFNDGLTIVTAAATVILGTVSLVSDHSTS